MSYRTENSVVFSNLTNVDTIEAQGSSLNMGISGTVSDVRTSALATWIAGNLNSSYGWEGICYSKTLSLFVAVSYSATNNPLSYSYDGIYWTLGTISSPINTINVTYSEELGLFVAVGANATTRAIYSTDGINWSLGTGTSLPQLRSICWNSQLGIFVAPSDASSSIVYSYNGKVWSTIASGASTMGQSISWSSTLGIFVSMAYDTYAAYSRNSLTSWTQVTIPNITTLTSVIWAEGINKFVCIGNAGTQRSAYSSDGITWLNGNLDTSISWRNLSYSKELNVILAVAIQATNNNIAYSTDGINWSPINFSSATSSQLLGSCWSPKLCRFVIVAANTGTFRSFSTNSSFSEFNKAVGLGTPLTTNVILSGHSLNTNLSTINISTENLNLIGSVALSFARTGSVFYGTSNVILDGTTSSNLTWNSIISSTSIFDIGSNTQRIKVSVPGAYFAMTSGTLNCNTTSGNLTVTVSGYNNTDLLISNSVSTVSTPVSTNAYSINNILGTYLRPNGYIVINASRTAGTMNLQVSNLTMTLMRIDGS